MNVLLVNLLFAGIPGPLVCLLYYRHFYLYYRKLGYAFHLHKYIESLLYGIVIALLLKLFSPFLMTFLPAGNPFLEGMINAAMLEKVPVVIVLLAVYHHYRNFSVIEAIFCAMWVGVGFSAVENIFYIMDRGESVILLRMLFSVPMHITGCGIIGYFLGLSKINTHRSGRMTGIMSAILIPLMMHGLYDFAILAGDRLVYIITPIIIIQFVMLELMISAAKNIPDMHSLENQGIVYDDWKMIYRQTRYERWINRSMGKTTVSGIRFSVLNNQFKGFLWFRPF
jgi:RsiW-degrading membrane proteinase PrsW (M82 family)